MHNPTCVCSYPPKIGNAASCRHPAVFIGPHAPPAGEISLVRRHTPRPPMPHHRSNIAHAPSATNVKHSGPLFVLHHAFLILTSVTAPEWLYATCCAPPLHARPHATSLKLPKSNTWCNLVQQFHRLLSALVRVRAPHLKLDVCRRLDSWNCCASGCLFSAATNRYSPLSI